MYWLLHKQLAVIDEKVTVSDSIYDWQSRRKEFQCTPETNFISVNELNLSLTSYVNSSSISSSETTDPLLVDS